MRKHSSFCEKPTLLKTNKLRPSKMLGLEFPAIPFRTLRMDWFFRNWTAELQGSLYECWIPSLKLTAISPLEIGKLCPKRKDRSPPIPPGFAGVNCCLFALEECVKNSSGRRCRKRNQKKTPKNQHLWCFEATTGFKGHLFWKSVEIAASNSSYKRTKKQRGPREFQWIFTVVLHLMHDVDGQRGWSNERGY